MGIGGHMLGVKKLRRLSALTGLDLRRAYIRGSTAAGVVWTGDDHLHYLINPKTGEHRVESNPMHWGSCSNGGYDPGTPRL